MLNRTKLSLSAIALLAPGIVFAALPGKIEQLTVDLAAFIGGTVPRLIFALALAYFLYGVFSYVSTGADEKKRGEAKNTIIYGLIILFVMSSVWGLVRLIQSAVLNDTNNSAPQYPTV
jgi:ABC-type dipeptide/oligopeptide/nickel transport system permease component